MALEHTVSTNRSLLLYEENGTEFRDKIPYSNYWGLQYEIPAI